MSASAGEEGPSVALALGSGAARGLAHIGVVKVLEEAGVPVRGVAGASIGAIVGGLHASRALEQFEAVVRGLDWQSVLWFLDPTLPASGIFGGKRLEGLLRSVAGERFIELLPVDFCAVACDLETGGEVRLRHGELATALRASFAIPGVFTPQRLGGRWLMDGGAATPVPVAAARSLGCDRVLAVDLHSRSFPSTAGADAADGVRLLEAEVAGPDAAGGPRAGAGSMSDAVTPGVRRFLKEAAARSGSASQRIGLRALKLWRSFGRRRDSRAPSLATIIGDSMAIVQMHLARSQLAADPPDLVLEPKLPDVGMFDFHRADEIIAEGERVAQAALEDGRIDALLRREPTRLRSRVRRWLQPGQRSGATG